MRGAIRRPGEPEAAWLRRTLQLWPECLSDQELARELAAHRLRADQHPISLPMLECEAARRGLEVRS